jgi:hypothetical protein
MKFIRYVLGIVAVFMVSFATAQTIPQRVHRPKNVLQEPEGSLNSNTPKGVHNAALATGSDISAKIAAIISSCAGASCPIFIPAGTYSFSTALSIPSYVHLYGAGQTQTILNYTGSTTPVISVPGNNVYLHDFALNGPVENVVTGSYNSLLGIVVTGNSVLLDKLIVMHFWGIGANIQVAGNNDVVSNSDLENGRIPLQALTISGHASTGAIFRSNYLSNHMSQAIAYEAPNVHHWDCLEAEGSTDTLIEGNTAEDCGTSGIYFGANGDTTLRTRVIGNKIVHAWNRGIDGGVTGDVTTGNKIYGFVIANNIVQDSAADNIWSVCGSNGVITGNYAEYSTGYAAFFGSYVSKDRSGLVVTDICGTTAGDITKYVSVIGNTSFDYTRTAFAGLALNIKATSVGHSWSNNITNVSFYQAPTISFRTNSITHHGNLTLARLVDSSGNSYFSGTKSTYSFGSGGALVKSTPTAANITIYVGTGHAYLIK